MKPNTTPTKLMWTGCWIVLGLLATPSCYQTITTVCQTCKGFLTQNAMTQLGHLSTWMAALG
jgi:hypothetical protein